MKMLVGIDYYSTSLMGLIKLDILFTKKIIFSKTKFFCLDFFCFISTDLKLFPVRFFHS